MRCGGDGPMTSDFPGLGAPSGGSRQPSSANNPFGGLPPASASGFPGLSGAEPFPGVEGQPADPASSESASRRPPLALLLGAVAAPLVSLPLLLLDGWGWHVLGWAVATFVAAALLIAATLEDTRRRASAWYLGNDALVSGLRLAAVVLALGAAAAHAWLFADWFARLEMFA
jgi:hypothetical protein